jgi:hypothetical protein
MANAGADQEKLVGQPVQLNGSSSRDVDDAPLTYLWALTAVPSRNLATLLSASVVNPSFVPDLPGISVMQLIVHDDMLV